MRLRDRVAIITGGGQGIGRATCLLLAKEGANIVIAEHNPTTAETVGKEVEAVGVRSLVLQTDVSDSDSVRSMVNQTLNAFGRIDILVNNAGIFQLHTNRGLHRRGVGQNNGSQSQGTISLLHRQLLIR